MTSRRDKNASGELNIAPQASLLQVQEGPDTSVPIRLSRERVQIQPAAALNRDRGMPAANYHDAA